ncbi:MAG: Nif11-like leader peptide family natural product precursor [Desulfobacterales bacterium]|nr:Nif11-like leader peptide family natural product precursor [Desulfobacterales bacterium]
MSFQSAQLFVSKMRDDKNFRENVSNATDKAALLDMVKSKGYDFDERDLVGAMAACMTEMEEAGS